MATPSLPVDLRGVRVHLVGIKGTGMCALAELLLSEGAAVSGSDTAETFYTDAILRELGVPFAEGFAAANLPADASLVVHSAAYGPETNPELEAAVRLGLAVMKYPEALGAYSKRYDSSGIAGVHGKTTTTALAGVLARAAGLSARVLAGSAVGDFGGRSTLCLGERFFIAETCEYRRHFLNFKPRRIVLTSVESDHQDYYPTYADIRSAFIEYCVSLPPNGRLIFCADDPGAVETAGLVAADRPDLRLVPYGRAASGKWRVAGLDAQAERTCLRLAGWPEELRLRVPGRHVALDAVAALALVSDLVDKEFGDAESDGWTPERRAAVGAALEAFRGSRRRAEIVGEAAGVLVMDDYGHHPSAIRTTLAGLKAFYPDRRLVVSFMSHTYSRTAALLDEFAASLEAADELILHRVYASAREKYDGKVTGRTLYERAAALRPNVVYIDDPVDAVEPVLGLLRSGDLFLTLGAGDNWRLGRSVYERLAAVGGVR
jgi:UDP-N-acetylmuramate--alanine ligase